MEQSAFERVYTVKRNSVYLRGLVMEATIDIERKVDSFLSNHFCKNDSVSNELKEMLWHTERITIGNKKDILFIILDRHHKDFLSKNKKFKRILSELIPHRNIFAHLETNLAEHISIPANEPIEITFKKYKNGELKPEKYSKDSIQKLWDDFKLVGDCLDMLLKPVVLPLSLVCANKHNYVCARIFSSSYLILETSFLISKTKNF